MTLRSTGCGRATASPKRRRAGPASPTRALVICGSPRNDGTCPGEISKTFRLARQVQDVLGGERVESTFST
jgi:hypothetical protein